MPKFEKNKRLLQERSHLTLEFPQSGDRVLRAFIPFLENPRIIEKGAANLNSYNLVGRAGELFSYGGAQSRRLSVNFNISFQHVIEVDAEEGISDKFRRQFLLYFTSQDAYDAFQLDVENRERPTGGDEITREVYNILDAKRTDGLDDSDIQIRDRKGYGRDYAATHRAYYRRIAGLVNQNPDAEGDDFSNLINVNAENQESNRQADNNKHIDLVYCWLNLIRASVLNRADNTTYGPPIVRLTHGPMYANVPCLVEDYNVKVNEEAGYEAQTLTPKQIQISLNLVESRTGDFGKYQAGRVITGDNLTGWESIIGNNEIDPNNGLISREGSDYAVL